MVDHDVSLAYIHPGVVRHEFVQSLLETLFAERDYRLGLIQATSGPLISRARNMLAEKFLESPATHLLFVDTDIQFRTYDISTLLAADKDIVGGLYHAPYPGQTEPFPVALDFDSEQYLPIKEVPSEGLVRVDGLGMGFTLIKRHVIEELRPNAQLLRPFRETVMHGRAVGEDLAFCLTAKESGFDSWLCVDARVGHIKSLVL